MADPESKDEGTEELEEAGTVESGSIEPEEALEKSEEITDDALADVAGGRKAMFADWMQEDKLKKPKIGSDFGDWMADPQIKNKKPL